MREDARAFRLSGHLAGLDGVRGLAILLVMAVHFVGDATPQSTAQRLVVKAASFGALGVDLFFVLSGFLITGLLLDAKGRPHYFRNFYARRTLRIFPLYYMVLTGLLLVLPRLLAIPPRLEQAREHQVWLWTYTANFYIAAKSSWGALTYVNHFWSLAIEEHFYVLWPLVVFRLTRERLLRVCVGVIAGGLVLRTALSVTGTSELSISVLTPCRIDTLCVGGLLAVIARREGGAEMLVRRSTGAVLALGAVVLALSTWCATTKLGLPVLHQVRNTLYALFFGALTLTSVQPEPNAFGKAFQSRLLRFFGKYSYGLYVYHGILTWYVLDARLEARFDALLHSHALAIVTVAALGVSASVVVAVLSYELIEKRFLVLKRFFEAREKAPHPAEEKQREAGIVAAPPAARPAPGIVSGKG